MTKPFDAGTALRRFGLCGGPHDLARLRPDPLGALLAELAEIGRAPPLPVMAPLTTSRAIEIFIAKREDAKRRAAAAAERARMGLTDLGSGREGPSAVMTAGRVAGQRDARLANPDILTHGEALRQEVAFLIALAVATPRPLEERLALFWANHFTVSAQRAQVIYFIGAFEREAIRPHMTGRFEDMLLAAVLHPAMLRYLDNHASIGPNAPMRRGRNQGRSVNENLAREVLELHTLGIDGGYTQADITEFAKALSGWTAGVWFGGPESSRPQGTYFDPDRHEPGPRTILGKRYPDSGADQARAVLRDLAAHPATIHHLSRKLVRHFVGERAPAGLVARLEQAWRHGGGDLGAVVESLLRAPEAWEAPAMRLRSPLEFVMAASRIIGAAPPRPGLLHDLAAMGQPAFNAPSPKGWPEEDNAWVSPDGLKTRLDWSIDLAGRLAGSVADPRALADQALGPALTDETRTAIARAESPRQGLAILLMSPEVQRR